MLFNQKTETHFSCEYILNRLSFLQFVYCDKKKVLYLTTKAHVYIQVRCQGVGETVPDISINISFLISVFFENKTSFWTFGNQIQTYSIYIFNPTRNKHYTFAYKYSNLPHSR